LRVRTANGFGWAKEKIANPRNEHDVLLKKCGKNPAMLMPLQVKSGMAHEEDKSIRIKNRKCALGKKSGAEDYAGAALWCSSRRFTANMGVH
jgi:hypothetical protein